MQLTKLLLLFCILTVLSATSNAEEDGACMVRAGCEILDIVFVIDSSESVGRDNFHLVLKFMSDFADNFEIGEKHAHFALVTYNDWATVEFNLDKFDDRTALDNAIKNVRYSTGNTDTSGALELVDQEIFNVPGVNRKNIPDVVVLITDGVHTDQYNAPKNASDALRRKYGATVISVGVSGDNGIPGYNYEELESIAGGISSNVFTGTTYSHLTNLINNIIERFPCKAPCPADITFSLETSEIMGEEVVNRALTNYVLNIADYIGYGTGKDENHIALAHFSSPDGFYPSGRRPYRVSDVQFGFADSNKTYVHERVNRLSTDYRYIYGVSDLRLGIKLATETFTNSTFQSRDNVAKFIILIATGFVSEGYNCCPSPFGTIHDDDTDWVMKMRELTDDGNQLYGLVIDVQGRTNRSNINSMTNGGRMFEEPEYRNISYQIKKMLAEMDCPNKPAVTTRKPFVWTTEAPATTEGEPTESTTIEVTTGAPATTEARTTNRPASEQPTTETARPVKTEGPTTGPAMAESTTGPTVGPTTGPTTESGTTAALTGPTTEQGTTAGPITEGGTTATPWWWNPATTEQGTTYYLRNQPTTAKSTMWPYSFRKWRKQYKKNRM